MSVKFNPFTGNFDLVDPMATGSTVIGGDPNSVLFLDSASALQTDSTFTYIENPVAGINEAYLNVLKTSARSGIDTGSLTFASKSSLVTSDTLAAGNDGTIYYGGGYNYYQFSGSVDVAGAVLGDFKIGCFNQVASSTPYTINNASSDYTFFLSGTQSSVYSSNVTIGASSDSPNLTFCGTYSSCAVSVTNNGTGTPVIRYVGVIGKAIRSAGAAASEVIGGEFVAVGGTLNYGVTSSGTQGSFYAKTSGTAATPTIKINSTNTGMYAPASNQLGFSVAGTAFLIATASDQIGLCGTSPAASAVITSTVTTTTNARTNFASATFNYNPAVPSGSSFSVLNFTGGSTSTISGANIADVTAECAVAAANGLNGKTYFAYRGRAQVGGSSTLSSGTLTLGAYTARWAGGTAANFTGGTINFVCYNVPAVPTGYTGSGVTQNYYGYLTADSSSYHKHTGGLIRGRTTVADVNYTVLQYDYLIAYTTLTAGRTVTLPAPSATNTGQVFVVKDEVGTAGANNITVQGAAGNIDGAATSVINTNYGFRKFYNNGTNYFTV